MSNKTHLKKSKETGASSQRLNRDVQFHPSGKTGQGTVGAPKAVKNVQTRRSLHDEGAMKTKDGKGGLSYPTRGDKEGRKMTVVKHEEKKPSPSSSLGVNHKMNSSPLVYGKSEIFRAGGVSPGLAKIREEKKLVDVLSKSTRTRDESLHDSKTKSKFRKQTSVTQNNPEMMLPKITINEVLQSWKIDQPRNRASSLAGKDPMEFLRQDRSLSDADSTPETYEDLRRCRYLRFGREDNGMHGNFCSCNKCEHGEGLRSTAYLNS